MKQDTVQLCVKVAAHTAEQIIKLAAASNIGVAEQLRQFIEKGLIIEGHSQNVDFIASIIRQLFVSGTFGQWCGQYRLRNGNC